MGTLVAKKYPAYFSKSPVDHTYVECGTGARGWNCWGGKSNGIAFKVGTASTIQANSVAQSDEKAGITCYAINGVCHQAANRILVHARVLVSGARGYQVSQALYGPYGRTRGLPFGLCRAPFNQFPGVTGDLSECIPRDGVAIHVIQSAQSLMELAREPAYVDRLLTLHVVGERTFAEREDDNTDFVQHQLALFKEQVMHRLDASFSDTQWRKLSEIREKTERERLPLERAYANREMSLDEFSGHFDRLTIEFQERCADALEGRQYEALFALRPGEVVTLINPELTKGPGPGQEPGAGA